MNFVELIKKARFRLSDTEPDFLWGDEELKGYANEAYNEAVIRMGGILDSTTAAICTVSVVAGTSAYALDSRILHITRAKLDLIDYPLPETTFEWLDTYMPGWESTQDDPSYYIENKSRHTLTLYPEPIVNDTLRLVVRRLPVTEMSAETDTPSDIPSHLQPGLVYWMCYLALQNREIDQDSNNDSARFELEFEKYFGPRKSANAQEFERDYVRSQVRFRQF